MIINLGPCPLLERVFITNPAVWNGPPPPDREITISSIPIIPPIDIPSPPISTPSIPEISPSLMLILGLMAMSLRMLPKHIPVRARR